MPDPAVTLRDVARQAGVHPATASRALNPETRLLVSDATARGAPPRAARPLASRRGADPGPEHPAVPADGAGPGGPARGRRVRGPDRQHRWPGRARAAGGWAEAG